jgi:DNA-binding transcriptional LysR family regulator
MNTSTTIEVNQTAPNAPSTLDWNLVRAFLAVVDSGSLSGATRLLATSQPTLSRQIAELERSMGVNLFERIARGLRLTSTGEALVPAARQMQVAAQLMSMKVLGQSQELAGTVRLTASEMTATYQLPPILVALRRAHPEIQIELSVSNRIENLLERQADIAIRHTRPNQAGLIAKSLGTMTLNGYAHVDYLDRVGGSIDLANLSRYDWIGYDTSDALVKGFQSLGIPVEREFFCFRCDNMVTDWQMALAGLGIGITADAVGSRYPQMRAVLPQSHAGKLPVWLTAHRELRQSARIRVVFDALAKGLEAIYKQNENAVLTQSH